MSIVINSASTGSESIPTWKRKGSDEEDECYPGPSFLKRSRKSGYYFTLESESPVPTDEDEESVYSFQDNETEYVRDTSDTSTDSWDSNDEVNTYRIEYELASPTPDEVDSYNQSSSDPEDVIAIGVIAAICDSDDLADNSDDSRSTVDSEIGKADYWTCLQCKSKNNNPLFRYCEKCYKERRDHFPPRPKRRKRKNFANQLTKSASSQLSQTSATCSQETIKLDSGLGTDSQLGSSQLSLDIPNRTVGSAESEVFTPTSSEDIFVSTQECDSQILSVDTQNSFTSTRSEVPSDKQCVVCATNPKNGVFVHGSIVHICCCYKCAVKVWKTNGRKCPVCKRKVTQVLKAYYN